MEEAWPYRDGGWGCDVYFCGTGDGISRFYHVELGTNNDEQKGGPIPLSPVAIINPNLYGRAGAWTACGEHIYWTGGLSQKSTLFPQLFKHNIRKYGLTQWEIQSRRNIRPYPFRNSFAAVDVVNQKLYFMGGFHFPVSDEIDCFYGAYPTDDDRWCGECFDLRTHTWSTLDRTPFKEIKNYCTRVQVAVKVKDSADDESMEIVYYDMAAGSILFLDVTDGGSCHRIDDDPDFVLFRRGPMEPLPKGLLGIELDDLSHTVSKTRAVVANQTFYWFNFCDWRLYAYDIKAKTWLKSSSLSSIFPCPTTKPDGYGFPFYPLLLGLPDRKMVLIISTSPGELTVASLLVCKVFNNNEPSLKVDVLETQAYCFDDPEQAFTLLGGEALLKTSSLCIPVDDSALSGVGGRIGFESVSRTKGTVKCYNVHNGYGLITPNDGGEDQTFYRADVKDFRILAIGEAVEFEVKCSSDGRTKAVLAIESVGAPVLGGISRCGDVILPRNAPKARIMYKEVAEYDDEEEFVKDFLSEPVA